MTEIVSDEIKEGGEVIVGHANRGPAAAKPAACPDHDCSEIGVPWPKR
jgi:hypothetical protein